VRIYHTGTHFQCKYMSNANICPMQIYVQCKYMSNANICRGGHWDLRYGGISYFSYGILVFSLKNCGIMILEILRYTVFAILYSKTVVIDKICLRYYGIEYPPMPPSMYHITKFALLTFV
jgi:hypothetical protein